MDWSIPTIGPVAVVGGFKNKNYYNYFIFFFSF